MLLDRHAGARGQDAAEPHRQGVVVVHRQRAEQDVVLLQPHPGQAEAGQGPVPPVVRHRRRLGQARRAGGEDVVGGLGADGLGGVREIGLAHRVLERGELVLEPRQIGHRLRPVTRDEAALRQVDGRADRDERAAPVLARNGVDGLSALGARQHHLRLDDLLRVVEHVAALMVVEQAHRRAGLGRAQDREHHLGAVGHAHAHRVAAGDAVILEDRRDAVGAQVGLAVGDLRAEEAQERGVGLRGRQGLEPLADRHVVTRAGGPHDPQPVQHRRQVRDDRRQPLGQVHRAERAGAFDTAGGR